jgi:DNA-binding response OmpR family regulator
MSDTHKVGNHTLARGREESPTTVIVVEPDLSLRTFITRLLSKQGYATLCADRAADLPCLQPPHGPCAVVYDSAAGWEIAYEWRTHNPGVGLVLLIDPSSQFDPVAAAALVPTATLSIPFENRELSQSVDRALSKFDPPVPRAKRVSE